MSTFGRIIAPYTQIQDFNGGNNTRGLMYVYVEPNTTTRATLYKESNHEELTNPLVINDIGQVEDFVVDADYKYWIYVTDLDNNKIFDRHNLATMEEGGGQASDKYYDGDFIHIDESNRINVDPTKLLSFQTPLTLEESDDEIVIGVDTSNINVNLEGKNGITTTKQGKKWIVNGSQLKEWQDNHGKTLTVNVDGTVTTFDGTADKTVTITSPEVNNGSMTVKVQGTTKQTFTANQSDNNEIDITRNDLDVYSKSEVDDKIHNGETEIIVNGTVIGTIYANQSDDNEIDIGETLPVHTSGDTGKVLTVNSDNETEWVTPGITGTIQSFQTGESSGYVTKNLSSISMFDAMTGEQQLTFKDEDNNQKTYLMLKEQSGSGFVKSNGFGLSVTKPSGTGIYGITSSGSFTAVPTYSEGYGIIIRDSGQILTKARIPEYGTNTVPDYVYGNDWTVIGDGPGNNRVLAKWQSESLMYIGLRYLGSGTAPRFTFIGKKMTYKPGSSVEISDVSSINQLYSYSGGIFFTLSGTDVDADARVNIDGIFCDHTPFHLVKYKDGDGNIRISFTANPCYQNT